MHFRETKGFLYRAGAVAIEMNTMVDPVHDAPKGLKCTMLL